MEMESKMDKNTLIGDNETFDRFGLTDSAANFDNIISQLKALQQDLREKGHKNIRFATSYGYGIYRIYIDW
jgi:hypothetical protein